MKRARYMVFLELCFVGLLCLATFLFAVFVLSGSVDGVGVAATLLSLAQIGLAFATLLVTPLDHFEWSVILSPQGAGVPFGATITAKDFLNATVTNFNGAVSLSGSTGGGQTTNTILGNLAYDSTSSGLYTLGFAFTPNTNMLVTHVRSYSGTKVSIWQTNGTLLASQNVTSVPGNWVETPLATPLTTVPASTARVRQPRCFGSRASPSFAASSASVHFLRAISTRP